MAREDKEIGDMASVFATTEATRCNILCAKQLDFVNGPRITINIITQSNKIEFAKSTSVVKILFTEEASKWEEKLADDSTIQQTISETMASDKDKKLILKKFVASPPPFVDDKGLPISDYIDFITEMCKNCKISTESLTSNDHKTKTKAMAGAFKKLETGIASFKSRLDTDCSSNGKQMKFKSAITKQLKSFISTLLYCLTHASAMNAPDAMDLVWQAPIEELSLKMDELKLLEEKEYNAKSVISLLEKKQNPSESDRCEAYKLLCEHLTKITVSESGDISDNDKKQKYDELGATTATDFIKQMFQGKLTSGCVAGIAASRSIVENSCQSSELIAILDYISVHALRIPTSINLSEALKVEEDIPVSSVEPGYQSLLIEPPAFSTKFKFNPPTYDVSRNWIHFVELHANPYFQTHNLSYKDKAAALWHCLPTTAFRNRYMRTFGTYLESNLIKTSSDFQQFYRKVGETFWPEQILLPHDYEKKLNQPSFVKQRYDETYGDFAERLKLTFRQAFPSTHDSDTNKLKLTELVFKGIKDSWLKHLLFKDHFKTVFETGEINKLISIMGKERIKYHKARKLASEGLSLNFIEDHQYNKSQYSQKNHQNSRKNSSYKSKNKQSRYEVRVQKEFEFLARNKNVKPGGGLIVPEDKIPEKVKRLPNFNPRNYLAHKDYIAVRKMAISNVEKRSQESHKKAANTRKYKRKCENKNRRENVLIEPNRYDDH